MTLYTQLLLLYTQLLLIALHLVLAIKVVRNWIVVQIFQGLTRDHLSAGKDAFVAGVNFEPRSGALVLNGLPGHLQFYSLNEDTLLYNVRNTII